METKLPPQIETTTDEIGYTDEPKSKLEIINDPRAVWGNTMLISNSDIFPYTDFFENNLFFLEQNILKPYQKMLNERRIFWKQDYYDFVTYLEEYEKRFGSKHFEFMPFLDFYYNPVRGQPILSTTGTMRESNLNRIFKNIQHKFRIKNQIELSKFILKKTAFHVPDFDVKLELIMNAIDRFLIEQSVVSSTIEFYRDHELDNLETIAISVFVKGIDVDMGLKMTEQIATEILKIDQTILKFIQIEIMSDENEHG